MNLKMTKSGQVVVASKMEAIAALEEMLEIEEELSEKMVRSTELKKAATAYAVKKKVPVLQTDKGVYFRMVQRHSRGWDVKLLKEIVKGVKVKVNGKKVPLWNKITKRVPDPDLISEAVENGWISEQAVNKAYLMTPQQPFLQKFMGEAEDA